jgi:hypothetical protein
MSNKKITAIAIAAALSLLALGALAQAETVRKGEVQVAFNGKISPHKLPRASQSPVKVSVGAKVSSTGKNPPPQLHEMSIAINSYGVLDSKGIPVCKIDDIQPATTADALAVCRRSLVGEGTFTANVPASGRSPFPASGKLYAFNGTVNGAPAILAHVYGVRPAPTSFTLEFLIGHKKGTFGTSLTVKLPKSQAGGYITGISLALGKTFSSHGKKSSYLSATCPAPKGVHVASFPFAKASFAFVGGAKLSQTLNRSCSVRGK